MLDVALKEWSIVCDLILEGRLSVLLRKGGIHETGGPGVFELEHARFALFPSWAHQNPASIKPAYRDGVERLDEPESITLRGLAEVVGIHCVTGRGQLDALDDLHCWTDAYLDMRFNYKPDRLLYLIVLRAYRLEQPQTIANGPEYAGCRSWVPLGPGDAIDDDRAEPVLGGVAIREVCARVEVALGS